MFTLCKKLVTAISLFSVTTMALTSSASAQQTVSITENSRWQAKITEMRMTAGQKGPGIPILKWTPPDIWVESQGPVQYARIKWKITQPYTSVSINNRKLKPKADGSFDINFGFTNNEKAFKIVVIDQAGKTHQGLYKLIGLSELAKSKAQQSRFRYTAGLGATLIKYTQSGGVDFNEYALTIKGGATYRLVPDQFDLSLSAFMNALALSSTSDLYEIRYLGVNARLGYHVVKAPSPLRLVMNAGFYYNTSFGSIGFSNMYGPQVYPELSYIFSNGHAMLLYAKFSPALAQSKIDFSRNKEIATGLHYIFPISAKHRLAVGFDLSKLDLATDTDYASTSTYSLSAGLSF